MRCCMRSNPEVQVSRHPDSGVCDESHSEMYQAFSSSYRGVLLAGQGQGYSSSAQEIRTRYKVAAIEPERLRGPQFHRAW